MTTGDGRRPPGVLHRLVRSDHRQRLLQVNAASGGSERGATPGRHGRPQKFYCTTIAAQFQFLIRPIKKMTVPSFTLQKCAFRIFRSIQIKGIHADFENFLTNGGLNYFLQRHRCI
jgi:hypothetical protein